MVVGRIEAGALAHPPSRFSFAVPLLLRPWYPEDTVAIATARVSQGWWARDIACFGAARANYIARERQVLDAAIMLSATVTTRR